MARLEFADDVSFVTAPRARIYVKTLAQEKATPPGRLSSRAWMARGAEPTLSRDTRIIGRKRKKFAAAANDPVEFLGDHAAQIAGSQAIDVNDDRATVRRN